MIPDRVLQVTQDSALLANQVALTFLAGRSYSSEPSGAPPRAPAQTLVQYPGANSASDVASGGGAIAPSVPVQLLFWGAFWNDAGSASRDILISKIQSLLSGPYTSALDQYGVTPPVFGGARVVTNWPLPTDPYTCKNVSDDLVWNLIDSDNAFSEPDETGGRNAYFAFMPPGTTPANPLAAGAHAVYSDYDPPFDVDNTWVAYVDFTRNGNGNVDNLTTSFAHELVELLTDPEQDGWYSRSIGHDGGEIGDICQSANGNKTAWVGDVLVPAYWSNRDNACVIPTNRFAVRLDGDVVLVDKSIDAEGDQSYPQVAAGGGLCLALPACCFKGPYHWRRFKRRESTLVRLGVFGYHSAHVTWILGGQVLSGSGTVTELTEVTREGPDGVASANTTIVLDYEVDPRGLILANNQNIGNFDVQVSASVFEDAASGGSGTNRVATVLVPFIGYEFDWDQSFQNAEEACDKARVDFWKATHPADRRRRRVPVGDPGLLPGWVSARQIRLAKAAYGEASRLGEVDPAAGQELLAVLLRRIGLPSSTLSATGRRRAQSAE